MIVKVSHISISIAYFVAVCTIAYLLMGDILFDLNGIQLDRSGDGFKNYFVFAYQYKHGDLAWFNGMQYPYGDLYSFADGQPAILFIFKSLQSIGIDISGYELLVVQGLPILGLLIAAFFLHKIMRMYNQTTFWTFATVSACLALSPQLFRFNSQFAMAYAFCFPSIWYLLLLKEKQNFSKYLFVVVTSIIILIYGYIHPYHLLICSIFLLSFGAVKLLYKKLDWAVFLTGLLPVFFFLIINGFLDIYDDRTANPWGAWHYKTEVSDMLPFYGWFANVFDGIFAIRHDYNEGYSYLGALIFVAPIVWLYNKIILKKQSANNSAIRPFIWSAVLVLLFSMGLHILITDKQINQWVPTLQQFRALGRFSWTFYYIGFIALSIYVGNYLKSMQSKKWVYAIVSSIILFWSIDIYTYTSFFNAKIKKYGSSNLLYKNTKLKDAIFPTIDLNDFQAVLPLPVPTEGAEKFSPQDNWFVKLVVVPFVYQTGLPMIGGYMSRMSQSKILNQYQLSASEYVVKEALKDFKNDKDVIIVVHKSDTLLFSDIIAKGYVIGESHENKIYGISIEQLAQVKKISTPKFSHEPIFYNDFNSNGDEGLLSSGIMNIDGAEIICDIKNDTLGGSTIELSMWYRIDVDKSNAPLFSIKTYDAQNVEQSAVDYEDKSVKRMEVIGKWVQLKTTHDVPINATQLKWSVNAEHLVLDHALITKEQDTFYHPLSKGYGILNHYIGKVE